MKIQSFWQSIKLLFALVGLFCLSFNWTGCQNCPEKTCSDLNLRPSGSITSSGDSINYVLSFTPIDAGVYRVEARDSVTNQLLYTSGQTPVTAVEHSFKRAYNPTAITWSVTADYCVPPKTINCTASYKTSSGGISVVVVERTNGVTCPTGLPFLSVPSLGAAAMPTTVSFYTTSGGYVLSNEAAMLAWANANIAFTSKIPINLYAYTPTKPLCSQETVTEAMTVATYKSTLMLTKGVGYSPGTFNSLVDFLLKQAKPLGYDPGYATDPANTNKFILYVVYK